MVKAIVIPIPILEGKEVGGGEEVKEAEKKTRGQRS
jgi:hypothetical protein